jgi:transposase
MEKRIKEMLPLLNEKQKRLFLAIEAKSIGYGGISQISKISGISRVTITQGIKELEEKSSEAMNTERIRKKGGGRNKIEEIYPEIKRELDELLEPYTKGNPENPLRWTSKSMRKIEKALRSKGYEISDTTIAELLKSMDYSLQSNRKELALKESHPDRNAQFEYINEQAKKYISEKQPVISIDAKKKEKIGNFENNGAEYSKKKSPVKVLDHDFPVKELGKAVPYGVYDISKNTGFVNVGISNDTAEFAVESINKWWNCTGLNYYPDASRLLITADSGGSNGYRVRLWKVKLQELSNRLGIDITVLHFPPGTSKWNKIEHRLFSFISKNWRGKPLIDLVVIINLIAATTTDKGLVVDCVADDKIYPKGIKVSDSLFDSINIKRHDFHGEWNYTISPQYQNL